MTTFDSIDICMDEKGQPKIESTGKASTIEGINGWFQDVKNEAITQEGELFYDSSYGWSMLDFTQAEYNDLIELEIQNRIKEKLSKRKEIDERTITSEVQYDGRSYNIFVQFKFYNYDTEYNLELSADRVEVIVND